MSKHKVHVTLLIAVLFAALLVVLTREREPEYGGRKLSEWVLGLRADSADAREQSREAIRAIGTNAVPYLVKWVRYEMPLWPRTWHDSDVVRVRHFERFCNRFCKRNDSLQIGAIDAFRELGPKAAAAIGELSRLLNQPNHCASGDVAGHVLPYLGKEALPPVLAALTNQQRILSERVAPIMEHFGTNARPDVPVIIQCLCDSNQLVAWYAPRILVHCKLQPDDLCPILTNFLRGSRSPCRVNFIDALSSFPEEAAPAVTILVESLRDVDEKVASHAARALGSLHDPSVIPVLKQSLEDARPSVRIGAARALGDFFQRARSAVPALVQALGDPDAQVREDATNAIRNIDPQALERVSE